MVSTRALANSTLVFRILVLLFLMASIVVMATNNNEDLGASFKDVKTYRYVIAAAIIGSIYTLIQMPFAIYHVCTEKRMIRNGCLPEFDFYADKVISFLLATGVGAGFAITYELKSSLDTFVALLAEALDFDADELKSDLTNFLNRGYLATGLLFLGFLCMAALSVFSSLSRTLSTSRGLFG